MGEHAYHKSPYMPKNPQPYSLIVGGDLRIHVRSVFLQADNCRLALKCASWLSFVEAASGSRAGLVGHSLRPPLKTSFVPFVAVADASLYLRASHVERMVVACRRRSSSATTWCCHLGLCGSVFGRCIPISIREDVFVRGEALRATSVDMIMDSGLIEPTRSARSALRQAWIARNVC